MESDEEGIAPKKKSRTNYSGAEFDNLRSSEIDHFFDVTDYMASDSEVGGDSEAEDGFDKTRQPTVSMSTANLASTSSFIEEIATPKADKFATLDDIWDSDDTDADPTYTPKNKSTKPWHNRNRISLFDDVSDSDSSIESPDLDDFEGPSEPHVPNRNQVGNQKKRGSNTQKNIKTCSFTKDNCKPETFRKFDFSQTEGPNIDIDTTSPLSIFLLLLGPFLNKIVDESNLFAEKSKKTLGLTKEELLAFFGILVAMGIHSLPSIRLYWSNDPLFHVDYISKVMSQRRFLQILRFLHLNDNENMPKRGTPEYDRLYKVRPLITHLNKTYHKVFNPSRYLSIDESMIGFKGRCSLKQYMPNKPTKRGFKMWVLACAITGYLVYFDVYEGKKSERNIEESLGECVVSGLAKTFEGLGYCLFFDRFFSSIPLVQKLLNKNLFACGTMAIERKGYPVQKLKRDNEMKTGDSDFVCDGEVSLVKWKDRGRKSVKIISNMHEPLDLTSVQRTTKTGEKITVPCPRAISDYNMYMGGVDHFDHLQSTYSIIQKSRKWWIKIFYFLLDSAIVNSYIIYKYVMKQQRKKPIKQLIFRRKLVEELLGDFCSRKKTTPKGKKGFDGKLNDIELSEVGLHLPVPTSSRRCARCATLKKTKRCSIECEKCKVALCLECFAPFHKL